MSSHFIIFPVNHYNNIYINHLLFFLVLEKIKACNIIFIFYIKYKELYSSNFIIIITFELNQDL
jgi:hypothetical protein